MTDLRRLDLGRFWKFRPDRAARDAGIGSAAMVAETFGESAVSEQDVIVVETARRLFGDRFTTKELQDAEAGRWLADGWKAIEDLGLPLALVPEEAGGFGLDVVDAVNLVRIAGYFAVPLPLAETMMAARILAITGLALPSGPLSVVSGHADDRLVLRRDGTSWRLIGEARRVPWGRDAAAVAVSIEHEGKAYVARVDADQWRLREETNLALEPRDTLYFDIRLDGDRVAPTDGYGPRAVRALGAAMRCLAIAGALERVLDMTVSYANERVQFGRPIGKFQAVQQNLAVLAGQAAAAGGAADLAADGVRDGIRSLPIAAAKVRVGEAAGVAAGIAHQVHGAIGFAHEHSLHFFTKRLWSWRDEFGDEIEWSRLIGHEVAAAGADGLWPLITAA